MIIGHGGNKEQMAQNLGCRIDEIIDMSSNLNPIGPPEQVARVIKNNLDKIHSLPQPDAMAMKKGFADTYGIDPDNVVAGNGTTFFIYTLPKALDVRKALVVGPTYSDYADACAMHRVKTNYFLTSADDLFEPDMDRLSDAAKEADLLFLCNPNNPTGVLISKEKIEWLIKKHSNVFFVLDESYLPFVKNAQSISMVKETGFPNLVVLSSMSKIFRIPGLRTGFLSGCKKVCQKVMDFYQPWSVNALAQAVITDIFNHPEQIPGFYRQTREYIKTEKNVFLEALQKTPSLFCYPGSTYFILAKLPESQTSQAFCKNVGNHKILIRDCANFKGLSDAFVRFSLKTRDENLKLAQIIKEVLANV